jgi:hypothetical protein
MRGSKSDPSCSALEDRLALLAGGDLDEKQAALARAHVADCGTCTAALSELRAALARARQMDEAEAPFDAGDLSALHGRVMTAVAAQPPPVRPLRARLLALFFPERLTLAAGAAAIAIFATVALVEPYRFRPEAALTGAASVKQPGTAAPEVSALAAAEPAGLDEEPFMEPDDDDDGDLGPPSHPLKFELRTRDPNIRIIWLAHQ